MGTCRRPRAPARARAPRRPLHRRPIRAFWGRECEAGHPLREARRTQINAQRVDRGRRLPRGIDEQSRSLIADIASNDRVSLSCDAC